MKDDVTISWPYPLTENVRQTVSAHSVTVEFEDGSSWQLGYLLTKLKTLIEKDDE